MAATTLAISTVGISANAESVTNYRSTGDGYGYYYANSAMLFLLDKQNKLC